jgi:hypothetical protein
LGNQFEERARCAPIQNTRRLQVTVPVEVGKRGKCILMLRSRFWWYAMLALAWVLLGLSIEMSAETTTQEAEIAAQEQ